MCDYKNFEEGKYPDERIMPADFPKVEELLVYGEDVDCPETEGDLRCKYNFPEQPGDGEDVQVPTIADLAGYKVPPLGLSLVTRAGGGMKGKRFIYAPGTFFENLYTIDKPRGAENADMIVAREEQRKNAVADGLMDFLEEKGLVEAVGTIKNKDAEVIRALFKLAIEFAYESRNPKETRLLAEGIADRFDQKDEAIRNQQGRAPVWSKDQIDDVLAISKELIDKRREENIIDITPEEIE